MYLFATDGVRALKGVGEKEIYVDPCGNATGWFKGPCAIFMPLFLYSI